MIESVTGGRRVHSLAAGIAVTVAVFATACGERSEPTEAIAGVYPVTIVGGNDRPVSIAAPASRIALLDPSLVSVFSALGARSRIAGIPVTSSGRLQRGALGDLHADLVVAPSRSREGVLSDAAAVSRAPVYVLPDTSIREVERAIVQLGLITAEPVAARRLVHSIEERWQLVAARLDERPRTTVFVDLGGFEGASDQSLIGDLIREARGRNVTGRGASAGLVGVDELLRADPSVYVATSDSGTTLSNLRRAPRARALTAVRRGRVVIIDSRLLGPVPAIGNGLEELARALHPEAFR